MLYNLILHKAQAWFASDTCTVKPVLEYINRNGSMREAQAQALLVYLFLKIEGGNKPLWLLFSEGFFSGNEDLSTFNINQKARTVFETNSAARALFEFSRIPHYPDLFAMAGFDAAKLENFSGAVVGKDMTFHYLKRDNFDYTEWRKALWENLSVEELSGKAMEYARKKRDK